MSILDSKELMMTQTAETIQQDPILKNYLRLCGSRYMAQLHPDIIQVTDDTDWDFYAADSAVVYNRLIELGLSPVLNSHYSFDDLVSYVFIGSNFQVILRSDCYTYSRVIRNFDPEFYRDYLWKSGPNKPSREQIQRIMNQMFRIAAED